MADKNENNYLLIGIAVVTVIILVIAFILTSNNNSQNEITCNSPYIKVGNSCCLDENSNNICDKDEEVEEEANIWELNRFSVDGGTLKDFIVCVSPGFKYDFSNLRSTSSENIEMALFHQYAGEPPGYGRLNEYYRTAVLVVYTDYNTDFYDRYEGVTCEVEEYYDGDFNEVNTYKFSSGFPLPVDKYGFRMELFYSQNDKPSEVKYIISCVGDESGNEFKRTFRFNIDYVDEVVVSQCMEK